jgi:putative transposase
LVFFESKDSETAVGVIQDEGWAGGQRMMPKPYSNDLRERVVSAVEKDGLSRRAAAAQFRVAPSTVVNWVERARRTGSAAPGQMGGYRPRTICGEHEAWLVDRIRERNFTLRGLVVELAGRGLEADYWAVWTFVRAQGLTHKKRRWSPASSPVPMSRADESSG